MSTYWGYVCQSHDPNLSSEHWFNHGEEKLIDVFHKERAGDWPNDPNFTSWSEPIPVSYGGDGLYGTTSPILWLRQHPRCVVALENEYGDTRPLEDE